LPHYVDFFTPGGRLWPDPIPRVIAEGFPKDEPPAIYFKFAEVLFSKPGPADGAADHSHAGYRFDDGHGPIATDH